MQPAHKEGPDDFMSNGFIKYAAYAKCSKTGEAITGNWWHLAPAAPATPTYDGDAPLTEEQNAALDESDEDEDENLTFA